MILSKIRNGTLSVTATIALKKLLLECEGDIVEITIKVVKNGK